MDVEKPIKRKGRAPTPPPRRLAMFCAAIILGACQGVLLAQGEPRSEPYVWKNVKVGGGGFIPGIVFSPAEKGLAYLRSDMGGAYRWDAKGQTWCALHDQLGQSSYFGTESIAPDPVDANVVYVAAGMYSREPAAMMRSRDRGKTWEIFPVDFAMGGNENGRGVGERLAVDPNITNILYFGSRYDGLQVSTDCAQTWKRAASFPIKGSGRPQGGGFGFPGGGNLGAGLSFVLFDAGSASRGEPTRVAYVGSTDPGAPHLFRSMDAGHSWEAVPGQPGEKLLPSHAALDANGTLYVSYGTGVGPSNVTDGAVWKFDSKTGEWTDVTPDKSPERRVGGYGGIAVDRQHAGTVAVATLNRWKPGDTVWRSTDGGKTWADIRDKAVRDVSETPFLNWGEGEASLGWWMAALAIDPFDSDHACYATGATIFATHDFGNANSSEITHWKPWVNGIEQTAVIALLSPAAGPHLISGFGDISGFTHEDLAVSPPMHANPTFGNTYLLEYAGRSPNVVVRAGTPRENEPTMAFSEDGGRTWQPLATPPQSAQPEAASDAAASGRGQRGVGPRGGRGRGGVGLAVSADGRTIFVTERTASLTRDRGRTWQEVAGLPAGVRPVPDRVSPEKIYAIDFTGRSFYASTDGGKSFAAIESHGLPDASVDAPRNREAMWPLVATLDREGDLWYAGSAGLFHSADGGETFQRIEDSPKTSGVAFGKAPPGKDYPAVFCLGVLHDLKAVWRSDDMGASWIRINDDQHQWGTRFRSIAADPRIFGRVYVGTDGRGIVYGTPDEAAAEAWH